MDSHNAHDLLHPIYITLSSSCEESITPWDSCCSPTLLSSYSFGVVYGKLNGVLKNIFLLVELKIMSLWSLRKDSHQTNQTSKYSCIFNRLFHFHQSLRIIYIFVMSSSLWILVIDCNNNNFDAHNWHFGMKFRNIELDESPHSGLIEHCLPHISGFPSIFLIHNWWWKIMSLCCSMHFSSLLLRTKHQYSI